MRKLTPIFILILIGAFYYGVRSYLPQSQPIGINQVTAPSPSPYVALTFEPYFDTKAANTTSRLGITVSMSEEFLAKTARLEISYNEHCLAPTISGGEAFPRLARPIEVSNGIVRATYTAGNSPVGEYGIIAYITTGPKASGDCQLSFTNKTAILDQGNTNILTNITPATIKLKVTDPNLPSFKQPIYHPDTLAR